MGRSKDLANGETRFANVSGDTFTGLVNITNTYSSDTTEQLRVSDNTGSKLDFFGHANGTKSIQAYADDGSTFYNLNLQPLGGYVTMPNQPAIEVSGPNITPQSQTWAKFDLNNNVLSRGGMSLDTTNDRITVPSTGYYLVNYWIMVNMSTNSSSVRALGIQLWKNGSIFNTRAYWSGHRFTTGSLTTHDSATGHFLVNCTANDYLELYMICYDVTTGIVFAPHIAVTFQG